MCLIRLGHFSSFRAILSIQERPGIIIIIYCMSISELVFFLVELPGQMKMIEMACRQSKRDEGFAGGRIFIEILHVKYNA